VKSSASRAIGTLGVAIATILVLLGIGVALFLNPWFVAFEQGRANAAGWTGFSAADLRAATDSILHDLFLGGSFGVSVGGIVVLDAREQAHMHDVRTVFAWFAVAVIAGAAILLIGRAVSGGAVWYWRAIKSGATVLAVTVVALGITALFAFDALFEGFHEVFFAGGSYTFDPRTERLVQLFPDQFWFETSTALAIVFIAMAVVVRFLAGRREAGASRATAAPVTPSAEDPRRAFPAAEVATAEATAADGEPVAMGPS
jgi:integral membrane protein (TIGR01906 family)